LARNTLRVLCAGLAFALLIAFSPAARAADFSPADNAAIRAYVLTAAKVNGFIEGTTALARAKNTDPALAMELEGIDADLGSLAQLRAEVNAHPRILAYYQRQGLSADDMVLLPIVMVYAAIAAEFPEGAGNMVAPAQVNFVRANKPLMDRLAAATEALEGGAGRGAPDSGDDAAEPDDGYVP
jgi:hypothetical protein